MTLPRAFMPTAALSRAFADPAQGFAVVGPWQAAEGQDWWAGASAADIRVGISSGIDVWDKALLDRLPALERIVVYGAGQGGLDLDEIRRRGIGVDAASTHAVDVAEHAVGMTLSAWRRIGEGDAWVRDGRWASEGRMSPTRRLAGQRAGVVGLGHIGRETAQRLAALGCDVQWWGPNPKPDAPWPRADTLEVLAQESDILVIAAFAHDHTRGLISDAIIRAVGPDGLIVNVSRGFVVDEDALIAALRDGSLGYAALDVFEEEPTPAARWADVPNCLLNPHAAGATHEAMAALRARSVATVREALGL